MNTKRALVATFGKFEVYHDPLVHRPYGLYRIYKGARYVGAQISFPNAEDCRMAAVGHADAQHFDPFEYSQHKGLHGRRGRPRKDAAIKAEADARERERNELLDALGMRR